jgi:5-methylphenazine-1-carboxylate 1-monooxygenase
VQTGATVTGFTDRDGSVEVLLSDRSNGRVVPATADVLIGADGLYSAVRAQLHPDEPPPRWSGVMMWRGTAEGRPFPSGSTLAITGSTSSVKFVAYPIAARGHDAALINWVAEVMIGDAAHPVYPIGSNGGSQAIIDARVLARELAAAASPADALVRYEAERLPAANKIVLATRDMPVDAVLDMVSARAPDGFDRIEDVLNARPSFLRERAG